MNNYNNQNNNNENTESVFTKFKEWYTGIPLVTRYIMTLSFAVPILMNFGIVGTKTIALIGPAIYEKLQIWRLFTHFFVNKLSFGFLMNIFFLYQSLSTLENQQFYGRKADYVWFFVFGMLVLDLVGVVRGYFFLPQAFMFYIMYYWSQTNRNSNVSFMFGFQFKAIYFPFVLIAFGLLTGGGLDLTQLLGIGVGHIYYFLKDIWPNQYGGRQFLATPNFIKKLFPEDIEQEQPQTGPTDDGKYKWGSGHKLN
ncbi:hypothetical protein BCR36DRAFT_585007 [Piromyces finnis]|uniref:Derlin n=1 Tax=Piromyces finnis TaxID=1754191 RepID=A0A1Y1V540_9FUNG|nr:hypothetical protein BCR36DRAFT_585007 [Piromyces finnis]|eukprot:ORX46902.1 hypothetical protein BCR36DRAFT_585007 [Piromyces finnis]